MWVTVSSLPGIDVNNNPFMTVSLVLEKLQTELEGKKTPSLKSIVANILYITLVLHPFCDAASSLILLCATIFKEQ